MLTDAEIQGIRRELERRRQLLERRLEAIDEKKREKQTRTRKVPKVAAVADEKSGQATRGVSPRRRRTKGQLGQASPTEKQVAEALAIARRMGISLDQMGLGESK